MTHTQRPEWDDFAPEDGTIFPVNQSLSDFPSGILPSGETNFYQKRETSDPFTSFVHIDSVLRLQSDGTLISSV